MEAEGHGNIGRNVTISHCTGQRYNKDTAEWDDYNVDIIGNYTEDRATRFCRRLTHDSTIVITNVEIERHYYRMNIHDFVEHAERTN
jgi:hypothetical protein